MAKRDSNPGRAKRAHDAPRRRKGDRVIRPHSRGKGGINVRVQSDERERLDGTGEVTQ